MPHPTCTVDGCAKTARSSGAIYCPMHYHRWYRHGSVERNARTFRVTASLGRRYVTAVMPGHPLAGRGNKVYVHRAVLFDAIGAGTHPCNWCAAPVRWDATRGDADCLTADHLNGIGDDNRPENLVPSCWACNTARGTQARSRALRSAGWWSNNDTIERLSNGGRLPQVECEVPS